MASVSCQKEVKPSQKEIETKMIGKWKSYIVNGEERLTNLRSINTYAPDGMKYVSNSKYSESKGGWMWTVDQPYEYRVEGNTIYENSTTSKVKFIVEVKSISEDRLSVTRTNITEDYKGNRVSTVIMAKVLKDYSSDILGMWEGVEETGEETYGSAFHRLEYKADGTYVYYNKSGEDWVPSKNVDNEYNVDGNWLATRWRPEAGADYNYEWWDIDSIEGDTMKWSALREKEDGSRFRSTITFKKVK